MQTKHNGPALLIAVMTLLLAGCTPENASPPEELDHSGHTHNQHDQHGHLHSPPNGGVPIVLGEESYHVEFVLSDTAPEIEAFILDGHLDEYVRITQPFFDVLATVADEEKQLRFVAVTNLATGESVGDTALFRVRDEWLTTNSTFDAEIVSIEIRSNRFEHVSFRIPDGNDSLHQH